MQLKRCSRLVLAWAAPWIHAAKIRWTDKKQVIRRGNGAQGVRGMAANHTQVDWRFWRNWGVAFGGFPLGGLAALGVAGGIETAWDGVLGGLAGGAVIGGVQWLALRPYLHLSPTWIIATSVGMGAGLALSTALLGIDTTGNALLMRGALTGLSEAWS